MNKNIYFFLLLTYWTGSSISGKVPPSLLFKETITTRSSPFQTFTLESVTCSQIGSKHESNEDYHAFLKAPENNLAIWAIFDGHRGSAVAEYLAKNLAKRIKEALVQKVTKGKKSHISPQTVVTLLKKIFYEINNEILHAPFAESGSTATVVILFEDIIYSANTGDSRTLFLFNNGHYDLTVDQRPTIPQEIERMANKRPYANLSMISRIFGRKSFIINNSIRAKNAEAAEPECTYYPLETVKAIILGSDGFWDGIAPTPAYLQEKLFFNDDNEARIELINRSKPFVKKFKKSLPLIEWNESRLLEFVDEQLVRESQVLQEKQHSRNPLLPQGSDDSSVTLILVK